MRRFSATRKVALFLGLMSVLTAGACVSSQPRTATEKFIASNRAFSMDGRGGITSFVFFPNFRKNSIEGYVTVQHGSFNWNVRDLHFYQDGRSFNPKPPRWIRMVGDGPLRGRLHENEAINYEILIPKKKINLRKAFTFYYRSPTSGREMVLKEDRSQGNKTVFNSSKKKRTRPAKRRTSPSKTFQKRNDVSFSDLFPEKLEISAFTATQENFLNFLTAGYKFGMSVKTADAVRPNDRLVGCEESQSGSQSCLEREIAFLGEKAKLTSVISLKTQTLNTIIVEFDRLKETRNDGSNDCLNIQDLLNRKIVPIFGKAKLDFNRFVKNFIWNLPAKQELRVISLCNTSDSGAVLLQYRQLR